jgi:hypothetical protein
MNSDIPYTVALPTSFSKHVQDMACDKEKNGFSALFLGRPGHNT